MIESGENTMKNTNLNTTNPQNLKKRAVSLLSKAIAKIILRFNLSRRDFLASVDEKLVLEANKQDPKASILAIAIRTGIDRRYIRKYLTGDMPQAKPDKLSVILEDIRWTAEKYYKSNKIPKHGPFKTFQSICEQRASGTLTYRSILDQLVLLGNLKDLGDKIEIVDIKIDTKQDDVKYSEITALQVSRLVDTITFNAQQKCKDDKLIQRTIYSTQVNPQNFTQLHSEIDKEINQVHAKIKQLLFDFEDEVEINTYPQYGISFLEFKLEE